MNLPFEPAMLQYLIVIATALTVSTMIGLKRGWRGQLMAFIPIVSVWGVLQVKTEALVATVNSTYKGILFFATCGSQADSSACLESSGVAHAMLVDPASADQSRLLLLLCFVSTIALVFILVMRFGRPPASLVQRLMGALLGVANGFTLSYLVLPLLSYGQRINLPVASAAAEEELPNIASSLPSFFGTPQVSAAAVVLVLIVLFVFVAVRLMRPMEV
jgi:hypothetical protein